MSTKQKISNNSDSLKNLVAKSPYKMEINLHKAFSISRKSEKVMIFSFVLATVFLFGMLNFLLFKFFINSDSYFDNEYGFFLSVIGVLGTLPILLTVFCRRWGFRYSMFSFAITCTTMIYYVISANSVFSWSCLFISLCSAVICILFQIYLKRIEKNEKHLLKVATTDELTNLPNRRALIAKLEHLKENEVPFAVVFVDINNFKIINDIGGHDDGDAVLVEIVKRWNSIKNAGEYIARFGGDELAIIIFDNTNVDYLTSRVEDYSVLLRDSVDLDYHSYTPSASFGVSLFPEDSTEIPKLLRNADTAMYLSKQVKDHYLCFFNDNMSVTIEEEAKVEEEIRYALANDGFFVVYQPQYGLSDRSLRGFEALARMKSKDGKIVSPAKFIPVAEKTGLISDLEIVIMTKALTAFKEYAVNSNGKFLIAVNISAAHLSQQRFISDIENALKSTGFPPECLELEITESLLISALAQAIDKLIELKKLGIKIALDDFGTGFASLNYLNTLPIDMIKIDKCFVDNIDVQNEAASFMDAIITLGHSLHYSVISEGVENEKQLDILRKCNCDCIQGFVWGRPLDLETAMNIATNVNAG